ncbi:hypothetical protein GHT06_020218 [Daphnia sinensis]|uniref:BED-type domain-containing protein n=1 Tax=Daphnia sinensis TaxID=1820382 RepID=A0AAD5PRD7_9CRUS|nr:hypothetical protein GHT06_020218 [Daphnia sinensis]
MTAVSTPSPTQSSRATFNIPVTTALGLPLPTAPPESNLQSLPQLRIPKNNNCCICRKRKEKNDSGPSPKRNRVDSDCLVVNYVDLPTKSPDTNPDLLNSVHTSNTTSQTKRLEYPDQYFKFHKCGMKPGNSLYKCMVGDCQSKEKILSTTDNSRGNLRKHIKTCHGNCLEEFSRLCKEIDVKSSGKSISATATPHKEPTQLKLSFEGYPRALTQTLLDSYVVDYICDAVLPVYHTERQDFRKFINRLCPKLRVRSRAFYRNLISKAYIAKKRELLLQLSQARYICTTADCWSTRRKSFLGVTVHWINNDLNRVSACLAYS